jgi:hypothetical protein
MRSPPVTLCQWRIRPFEVYSSAIREYLDRHAPDEITEALDLVVSDVGGATDPFVVKLPSLDIVIEGHAVPLDDADDVRRAAETLKENGWPLEVRGIEVFGPNAPSAGPPPYRIFRVTPSKAFGLPGQYGMDKFDPADLPKPTRWVFGAD